MTSLLLALGLFLMATPGLAADPVPPPVVHAGSPAAAAAPLPAQATLAGLPGALFPGRIEAHGQWWRLRFYAPALLALGALIASAAYFAWAWTRDRGDRGAGLLALLAAAAAGQLTLEIYRGLIDWAYPQRLTPLVLVIAFATAFSLLLTLFASQRFAPAAWRKVSIVTAGVILTVLVLMPGPENKAVAALAVAGLASGALALNGVRQRRDGAVVTALGAGAFLAALIIQPGLFHQSGAYLAIGTLMLVLIVAQVAAIRRREQEAAALRSRAARLELELLKNQLAPHVLLNTLASLSEWVDSDPATGSRMIEALADELRALTRVSGQTLIPVADEIALCRAHLALMSLQRDRTFTLSLEAVDESALVPPALFHTAIENALTHNRYAAGATFTIRRRPEGYVIEAPAGEGRAAGGGGRGTAYMEGRLSEAFGQAWTLVSGPSPAGGWTTTIGMPV